MPPRPKIIRYRELPPKWRIVQPAEQSTTPAAYLRELDRIFKYTPSISVYETAADDVVAQVFGHQLTQHATQSYHLAKLVTERQRLAYCHIRDINDRLGQLEERIPLRPRGPGSYSDGRLTEVERQILDLERQKRLAQRQLWRDLLDTRQTLVDARREYQGIKARIGYLAGGSDAHY